jgi:hypothetical protein
MEEIIIFCSAPADIKYALTLREEQPQANCRIFALQVEGLALFLRDLRLPERTEVEFIPYPPKSIAVKRIWNNLNIRCYLNRMKEKYFLKAKNVRVYFFAPYMDWVLFSFLHILEPASHLIYVSYLPPAKLEPVRLSVQSRLMLFWTRWVTRADLVYARYHTMQVPVWAGMSEVETMEAPDYCSTVKKYAWAPPSIPGDGNNLLFFPGCDALTKNLKQVTLEIIQRLQERGFCIFVKPHPRLGCPGWLLDLGVKQIPRHVPAEFVDLSFFSGVVGYESTALAVAAKLGNVPCVSLIDLLDYHQASSPSFYKDYVSKYSEGKVVFAANLRETDSLLLKRV